MESILVLVRHGQSEWNEKGLWTGWTDIPLSSEGEKQAFEVGEKLKNIHFDFGYTSNLKRAQQTMEQIQKALSQSFPVTASEKLNERDYGIYTGKNKWNVEKEMGTEEFTKLRRSWDYPIEQGESLKQVSDRVLPYFENDILPKLKEGKHILVAAHGNSLRTLIKQLEHIPDDKIAEVELATGEAIVYTLSEDGTMKEKKIVSATSGKVS